MALANEVRLIRLRYVLPLVAYLRRLHRVVYLVFSGVLLLQRAECIDASCLARRLQLAKLQLFDLDWALFRLLHLRSAFFMSHGRR